MSNGYRLSKTALAAACHFIREHERITGSCPRGLMFNKFMVLLNRRLLDLGNDMKLPHCWYRWGDEVISYAFKDHVAFDREGTYLTTVRWLADDIPLERRMPYSQEISGFTQEFIAGYVGKEGSESAIDETYEDAPYDFQNLYRMVRENLKGALDSRIDPRSGMLPKLFENAMDSFPAEFNSIRIEKDRFRELFGIALSKGAGIDDLYYMSEDFWFFFCYHLRLKKHYNASEETLGIWRRARDEGRVEFEEILQDIAASYAADSDEPWIVEAIAAKERRMEEFEALLDSLYAGRETDEPSRPPDRYVLPR